MSIKAASPNLVLTFDVDQVNSQLQLKLDDGARGHGKHAGAVALAKGGTLRLAVTGYGPSGSFKGFEVLDCNVVTVPLLVELVGWDATYAAPSPFAEEVKTASQIVPFAPAGEPSDIDGTLAFTALATRQLPIDKTEGRWKMTIVVTVRIDDGSDDGLLRVFEVDPETQTGDGG